jgi:hypothetical protein
VEAGEGAAGTAGSGGKEPEAKPTKPVRRQPARRRTRPTVEDIRDPFADP